MNAVSSEPWALILLFHLLFFFSLGFSHHEDLGLKRSPAPNFEEGILGVGVSTSGLYEGLLLGSHFTLAGGEQHERQRRFHFNLGRKRPGLKNSDWVRADNGMSLARYSVFQVNGALDGLQSMSSDNAIRALKGDLRFA